MIDLNRFISKIDRFLIEIAIVDLNPSLDFKSDRNQRSNSDFIFDSTTTIPFVTPNRISLVGWITSERVFHLQKCYTHF